MCPLYIPRITITVVVTTLDWDHVDALEFPFNTCLAHSTAMPENQFAQVVIKCQQAQFQSPSSGQ